MFINVLHVHLHPEIHAHTVYPKRRTEKNTTFSFIRCSSSTHTTKHSHHLKKLISHHVLQSLPICFYFDKPKWLIKGGP